MHRFHAHPDKAQNLEQTAQIALLAAGVAILFEAYRADGTESWAYLAGSAIALVGALYVFVRNRLVSRLPVMEITASRLRWRKPGHALFSSVRLDDIVALQWSESVLVITLRGGMPHSVPLTDLHFRGGSFAVNILRSELERIVEAVRAKRGDRQGAKRSQVPEEPAAIVR